MKQISYKRIDLTSIYGVKSKKCFFRTSYIQLLPLDKEQPMESDYSPIKLQYNESLMYD